MLCMYCIYTCISVKQTFIILCLLLYQDPFIQQCTTKLVTSCHSYVIKIRVSVFVHLTYPYMFACAFEHLRKEHFSEWLKSVNSRLPGSTFLVLLKGSWLGGLSHSKAILGLFEFQKHGSSHVPIRQDW